MSKMKVVEKKIASLIEADYNPRELTEKQYKDLKKSLETFGLVDPILVNKNKDRENVIIGGHQRLRVWRDLGHETIPCVELDLDLEKEKELNVRLNKNTGQFNMEGLANFFNEEDLIEWGFEEYEFGMGDTEIDYSVLDDEDTTEETEELEKGMRKAIQVEFEMEYYQEALDLVHECRQLGADI